MTPTPTPPTPSTSTSTSTSPSPSPPSSPILAVAIHAASALPSGDAKTSAKVVQRLLWGGVRVALLVEGGRGEAEEVEAGERLVSGSSLSSSSSSSSVVEVKLCPIKTRQCWKCALSDAVSSLGLPAESVALAVGAARGSKGDFDDDGGNGGGDVGCHHCCPCSEAAAEATEGRSPRGPAEDAARELGCLVIFVEEGTASENSKGGSSSTAIERAVAQSHASSKPKAAATAAAAAATAATAASALLVGVCMRASREEDLLSRGMLPRVPLSLLSREEGKGGESTSATSAAVVFERVLASELEARCSRAPPLDAILHKVTDELGEREGDDDEEDEDDDDEAKQIRQNHPSWPRAARSLAALSSSSASSSSSSSFLVVVDDVASVMLLSDRFETAEALSKALGTAAAEISPAPPPPLTGLLARPPPSLCVSAGDGEVEAFFGPAGATAAAQLLSERKRGLSFPVIVKPRAACGVPEAHRLAVALDERGLEAALRAVVVEEALSSSASSPSPSSRNHRLPAGAVIQRYIDHGGVVFKVYAAAAAAGEEGGSGAAAEAARVFVERRASTPDLGGGSSGGGGGGPGWLSFDSAAPLSVSVPWPSLSTKEQEDAETQPPSLDPRVAVATAEALLSALGLSLLGFDVVVERGTGLSFVVDVNYFPSMKGGATPRGVLADAVAARVAQARSKEKKEEKSDKGRRMSPRQGLVRGTLNYLRRDLREIVAPTSLPDDEDGKGARDGGVGVGIDGDSSRSSPSSSRRFAGRLRAVASGVSDYLDSWKKPAVEAASNSRSAAAEAAPEEPEDAALREAAGDARDALASASRQAASSVASGAAAAAAAAAAEVSGSEALRPALRHLYRTRAAAYRDAVFSFVEGYREGVSGAAVVEEGEGEGGDDDEQERGSKAQAPLNKETTTTPRPPLRRNDEQK